MKIDFNLIKFICMVAIGVSVLSTPTIQKIKSMLKSKKYLNLIAFLANMVLGELFTISFTNLGLVYGLWVGFIAWLGAEAIYKSFENKLFTPFSDMNKPNEDDDDDKDEIIIDRDGE